MFVGNKNIKRLIPRYSVTNCLMVTMNVTFREGTPSITA